MTKRDFFIVIIKIFGLYLMLNTIFQVIPASFTIASMDGFDFSIIWFFLGTIILICLFILLIFLADKVVTFLKLDLYFDDDRIDFGKLNSVDIIKIATFIISGLLIINNLPYFVTNTLIVFKNNVRSYNFELTNKFEWAVSGINLILGYFLISNMNFIAQKIDKTIYKE